ncbi:MAG: LysE family translocator [Parasphingorhabdus sp.]|uniref:LysE family translocator n=1 Tax=Parasphingorhabdus sp. TaxID=2709688 RepID=UPI003298FDFF
MILALAGFAFATSITPGPNNLMLMASGANFGFRRTVPHMLGISLGHMLMIVLVGLGLNQLFVAFPPLELAMKVASVAYLLFLAWKIANAAPPKEGAAKGNPLTFLQAALFQWVNPKAWFMALTATTVYAPDQNLGSIIVVAAVFASVNLPSVSTWTFMGQQIRHVLTSEKRLRAFNWTMAALLVASLALILK